MAKAIGPLDYAVSLDGPPLSLWRRGNKLAERGFPHDGEGMADMAACIGKHTGAPPEAVAATIEVPHGPVVEGLMERGFAANSVNPKQLAASAIASRRPAARTTATTTRCLAAPPLEPKSPQPACPAERKAGCS
ncbi:hypothetical protein KL86PLE_40284 [uncultured Pleomorphomonas sp.]|uniref:Uncharacterized protein n=1 Tax=uncultured Pleomorphomonas sp. TaxID=442121 RepID=A0A212LGG5_9HYPH|nr:hypothetical protein KL86PLE_40284 [uncultured Pleomorphomonas sp.]